MCEPLMLKAAQNMGGYSFDGVFKNVGSILEKSDYVIGNLETPLAGKNARYVDELFSFNAPDEFAKAIRDAGINFVSTANNHCMDRGLDGLVRTIKVLYEIGLAHDGTYTKCEEAKHPFITYVDEVKIAIIPFTYGINYANHHRRLPNEKYVNLLRPYTENNYIVNKSIIKIINGFIFKALKREQIVSIKKFLGLTYNSPKRDDYLDENTIEPYFNVLNEVIKEAKRLADVVIFIPHLGGQFNIEPGVFSQFVVRKAVEMGADIVIGSHPHIVQSATVIDNCPVFYSIGNFTMSPNSCYLLHEHFPDMGLVVHLYLDLKRIIKITFSIVMMVENNEDILTVWPVDKLYHYQDEKERTNMEDKVKRLLSTVYQGNIGERVDDIIKSEYIFVNRGNNKEFKKKN